MCIRDSVLQARHITTEPQSEHFTVGENPVRFWISKICSLSLNLFSIFSCNKLEIVILNFPVSLLSSIKSTTWTFAPKKSKAISSLSKILAKEFNGQVPEDFQELEKLPGVGHKTASVVMSQGFGHPAFPVDTHIHRLAQRWGLTNGKNVIQTEYDLKRLFPKKHWNKLHLQIIYYGREFCKARDCYGLSCKICTTCYPGRKKPFIAKKP